MLTNQSTKTNLARLLATENINVEYRKTDTASFNVESRTLTLPVWNDMTPDMEDLLIGHEVGHALDTPKQYGDEALQKYGNGFKSFLNVVEDARIEKRIKDRYPGLKRSFSKGYSDFAARDFFQIKNKDVGKMLLIDRLNLYYKIGPFFNVKFNEQETVFIRKIDAVDTFDDVIAVCKELYDYCKQELEEKRQEALEQMKQSLGSGDDEDFDDFEDYDSDGFNNDFDDDVEYRNPKDFKPSDEEGEDDDEFGYSNESGHGDMPQELEQYGEEVKSTTDEALQKSLQQMTEKKQIATGKMPSTSDWKYDDVIIDYKKILGNVFDESLSKFEDYKPNMLMEFEAKNKNAILYLVKEFELRKKAAELRRVVVSDTGVLDTNKLHTYKFNDDIFRKVGSVAAGKNHGVVMFIDWSGSMTDNMKGTIEQLITLTTFCRKINVPFDVYAFSTEWGANNAMEPKAGQLDFSTNFSLLNLFSSRMRNQEYRRMGNDLLNYGEIIGQYYKRGFISEKMGLGGTPLNSTIAIASGIVNRFRKAYKAEVVDVIFLTDGEDSSTLYTKSPDYYGTMRIGPDNYNSVSYIEDVETRKRYRVGSDGVTPALLKILKDKTGCGLIGFYIMGRGRRAFDNVLSRLNVVNTLDSFGKFKSEKFFAIDSYGYDQYFLIPGGDALSTEDEDLDDLLGENNKEVSTRKLKGAFIKMNQNRLTNRVLLSKVIEEMA